MCCFSLHCVAVCDSLTRCICCMKLKFIIKLTLCPSPLAFTLSHFCIISTEQKLRNWERWYRQVIKILAEHCARQSARTIVVQCKLQFSILLLFYPLSGFLCSDTSFRLVRWSCSCQLLVFSLQWAKCIYLWHYDLTFWVWLLFCSCVKDVRSPLLCEL